MYAHSATETVIWPRRIGPAMGKTKRQNAQTAITNCPNKTHRAFFTYPSQVTIRPMRMITRMPIGNSGHTESKFVAKHRGIPLERQIHLTMRFAVPKESATAEQSCRECLQPELNHGEVS